MAVKARWERPDRRRFLTVTAPLFVELGNGTRTRAVEWSLGGLSVADVAVPLPEPGAVETLKLTLPFQGFDVSFLAKVNIIERNPALGAFAAEFVDLGERERGLLCHFLDELVRGSMAPVEDTIQRIDVPVAPLPLESQSLVGGPGVSATRSANAGFMTALYALLGMMMLGYIGLLLYSNLVRFEIDSARLSVPTDRVQALGEGHLRRAGHVSGASVQAGDVLAYVYDNQLEREIELAEISVKESEAKVANLQRQATGDRQRLSPNAQRARLEIDSMVARIQASEQEVKRLAALPRTGQNVLRLEEARKKLLSFQKTIESKQVELTPLEAVVFQGEQELGFTRQRHKVLIDHRDRLAARAPFDGIIVDLPRADQASVRKGDVIAVVEQRSVPTVTAMLSPADSMRIGLGEQARLYLPSAGTFMKARVTSIDRMGESAQAGDRGTTAHTGPHSATLGWSRVELQVEDPKLLMDRSKYRAGMPVVVQFQRRWANALVAAVAKGVSETVAAIKTRIGIGAHAAAGG